MNWNDLIWGAVGFLLTVMIFSYLIGDNLFFRLASSVFIGLTAGYLSVLIIREILIPYLWEPLAFGLWSERLWTLVPLALITLLILSQFPKFSKLGSLPLAFLAGLAAAITVGGAVFGTLIPQTRAVIEAFDPQTWQSGDGKTWMKITDATIMLIGTVATLAYFHFGRKKSQEEKADANQRPVVFEIMSKFGQVFIGLTLGAIFAGIFSTALFALVDRLWFLGEFVIRWTGGN